jgi:3-phosphoshikimate 1-carboxyvinyltransferase
MKYVEAGKIDGRLAAPASKSMAVRAAAAALLTRGKTRIEGWSRCEDAQAALCVARSLGAQVETVDEALVVEGGLNPSGKTLDCGESGLSLRLFAALAGLCERPLTLTGHGTLTQRPLQMVIQPLRDLGVECTASQGRLPLEVCGPMRGGRVRVDGSVSSQSLTGLLMALPLCAEDSRIQVRDLTSKPYVRMTLELLDRFGVRIQTDPELRWMQIPGGQSYRPGGTYRVPGDWSGAAAVLVAGALCGRVSLTGLSLTSSQADRAVLDALTAAGARVSRDDDCADDCVTVERGELRAFTFDLNDCPDLAPALVALASACPGRSELRGASRLAAKESDRASVLVSEFGKLGADVRHAGDSLVIHGGPLRAAEVDSHNDHRIAMACAVGALGAGESVCIRGAGCVAKSYPGFFDDLAALGAVVR